MAKACQSQNITMVYSVVDTIRMLPLHGSERLLRYGSAYSAGVSRGGNLAWERFGITA